MPSFDSRISADGTKEYFLDGEIPSIFKKIAYDFFNVYGIQNIKLDHKDHHDTPIFKARRTCIFCGLSHPDVTFRHEAHFIPKSLGNLRLLSYRECDECNNHFAKYENDLSNYIGYKKITRTLRQLQFRPPANRFILSKSKNKTGLHITSLNKKIKILVHEDRLEIPFKTHSFSMFNIWKLLAKIALSCMPESDIANYSGLCNFLFADCKYMHETHYKHLYQVYHYKFKATIHNPIGILYKKKSDDARSLTHTFQLYFFDEVWQIFLPMNDVDDKLYDNTPIINFPCPPTLLDSAFLNKDGNTPIGRHFLQIKKLKLMKFNQYSCQ